MNVDPRVLCFYRSKGDLVVLFELLDSDKFRIHKWVISLLTVHTEIFHGLRYKCVNIENKKAG